MIGKKYIIHPIFKLKVQNILLQPLYNLFKCGCSSYYEYMFVKELSIQSNTSMKVFQEIAPKINSTLST